MKIQDLKIGNLIQYKKGHLSIITGLEIRDNKELVTVKGLDDSYIDGCYELNNFYPVKLSEDLISKLPKEEWNFVGFGMRVIYQHIKFKTIKFEYTDSHVVIYFNDEIINFKNYVHQLQNIYFTLTEMELKLNK